MRPHARTTSMVLNFTASPFVCRKAVRLASKTSGRVNFAWEDGHVRNATGSRQRYKLHHLKRLRPNSGCVYRDSVDMLIRLPQDRENRRAC